MLINKSQLNAIDIASTDRTRPVIESLRLRQLDDGRTEATATDGYTAIKVTADNGNPVDFVTNTDGTALPSTHQAVIHRNIVTKISKILPKPSAAIKALPLQANVLIGDGVASASDTETIDQIKYSTEKISYDSYPHSIDDIMAKPTEAEKLTTTRVNPRLLIDLLKQFKDQPAVDLAIEINQVTPKLYIDSEDHETKETKAAVLMPLKR